MKYNIGDKVWIKKLKSGESYGDFTYYIGKDEKTISNKLIEITGFWDGSSFGYISKEYRGIAPEIIDDEKTNSLKNPSYEIY